MNIHFQHQTAKMNGVKIAKLFMLLLLSMCVYTVGYTQSARQEIQDKLSRLAQDDKSYTHHFQYLGGLTSIHFTYEVLEKDGYVRYLVNHAQIASVDVVEAEKGLALLISLDRPMTVDIRNEWNMQHTRQEQRQILLCPIRSYQEGKYVQHLFRQADSRLHALMNRQKKQHLFPELISLPQELSSPYSIGKYPVTVAQYRSYCRITERPMPSSPPWGWQSAHPMVNISWQDAQDYCVWLSRQTGRLFELPTADKWQYVAFSETERSIDDVAWWGENAGETTQPVGRKKSNTCGAYDMQGNVWEWLEANEVEPEALVAGGSWDSHFEQCQWNSTVKMEKVKRALDIGFRLIETGN